MKLFFIRNQYGAGDGGTINYVNRSRAFMPPGRCRPLSCVSTPAAFRSATWCYQKTKSIPNSGPGIVQGAADVRELAGRVGAPPFGGTQRTIVVAVDPDRLLSYNLSPEEVIAALTLGNTISPSGNARILDQMPIVAVNAMVKDPKELGTIPLRLGESIYLRDVATISDSTDIPSGYALVDGKRAVYLLVTKRAEASTLAVVNAVKDNLPKMRAAIPEDIEVRFEFDQSPYVQMPYGMSGSKVCSARA